MNQSLKDLQDILFNRVRLLSKQLDDVTDPAQAQAILDEMREFNHRVTMVGGLLFREQSAELEAKVEAVSKAKRRVDEAIKNIQELNDSLQVITDFLALVDEAIDLAKLL